VVVAVTLLFEVRFRMGKGGSSFLHDNDKNGHLVVTKEKSGQLREWLWPSSFSPLEAPHFQEPNSLSSSAQRVFPIFGIN